MKSYPTSLPPSLWHYLCNRREYAASAWEYGISNVFVVFSSSFEVLPPGMFAYYKLSSSIIYFVWNVTFCGCGVSLKKSICYAYSEGLSTCSGSYPAMGFWKYVWILWDPLGDAFSGSVVRVKVWYYYYDCITDCLMIMLWLICLFREGGGNPKQK